MLRAVIFLVIIFSNSVLPEACPEITRLQCPSVLDNPRADIYNKDKERRCPHSGQLSSSGVTLENMTAVSW